MQSAFEASFQLAVNWGIALRRLLSRPHGMNPVSDSVVKIIDEYKAFCIKQDAFTDQLQWMTLHVSWALGPVLPDHSYTLCSSC